MDNRETIRGALYCKILIGSTKMNISDERFLKTLLNGVAGSVFTPRELLICVRWLFSLGKTSKRAVKSIARQLNRSSSISVEHLADLALPLECLGIMERLQLSTQHDIYNNVDNERKQHLLVPEPLVPIQQSMGRKTWLSTAKRMLDTDPFIFTRPISQLPNMYVDGSLDQRREELDASGDSAVYNFMETIRRM